ncbi:TPA: hypothetical protein ACGDUS_001659, partial [Acinetobacter baumannii]
SFFEGKIIDSDPYLQQCQELKDYLSDQFKKLTELTDFEIIMEDQCRFGSRERALQVIQAIIKQWPKAY